MAQFQLPAINDEEQKGHYGNFTDPVGLLKRMLRSEDQAARAALVRAGMALSAVPLDRLLQIRECRYLAAARPSDLPLVFIVGAPRSGTTLVSQVLSRYMDVSHFTNLCALFPHAPIAATKLFGRGRNKDAAEFRSFYGQTRAMSAPNDGFEIWNRWLGQNRYQVPKELSQRQQDQMRTFFNAWQTVFPKPFINKNNRNTICADLLLSVLPNAYVLHVDRNPLLVSQSLINARQQIQGTKNVGWGLASRSSSSSDPLSYVDDVCDQVFHIRRIVSQQQPFIPAQRFLNIRYEDFCEDPRGAIDQISNWIPALKIDGDLAHEELKPFEVSNRLRLQSDELARLRQRIEKWEQASDLEQAQLCSSVQRRQTSHTIAFLI